MTMDKTSTCLFGQDVSNMRVKLPSYLVLIRVKVGLKQRACGRVAPCGARPRERVEKEGNEVPSCTSS